MQYIGAYLLKLIAFFSFCMFLAILVKRSAFALGFLVLWQVIEGIIAILFQYIKVRSDGEVNLFDTVYNFLPLNAMSDLIVEPFTRFGAVQSAANQLGGEFRQELRCTLVFRTDRDRLDNSLHLLVLRSFEKTRFINPDLFQKLGILCFL